MQTPRRKSTNLSLDRDLLSQAKALKINLSRAAEQGLRSAVLQAGTDQWKAENAAALESSNAYTQTHGLPLTRFRQF